MKNEKFRFLALIIIFISICFILSSTQPVSANGGVFVDFGEHVYLPSQKAAILWDGTTETMIISTKIQSENLSNMAWVTPVPSSIDPQISEGNIEVFNEIAESFAEYTGGGYYYSGSEIFFSIFLLFIIGAVLLGIAFVAKKIKLTVFIVLFLVMIICASFFFFLYIYTGGMIAGTSESGYQDVEVLEMKTVDFYDIAVLKATNATNLVSWLEENDFIVSEDSIPILQEYCNLDNFYFIVNKIDLNNTPELVSPYIEQIEEQIDKMRSNYENLTNSNIYYFEYTEFYFYQDYPSELEYLTMRIFEGESYSYTNDFLELINLSEQEYNLLKEKYPMNYTLLDGICYHLENQLCIPYSQWLEESINAELTFLWNENGFQKEFIIENEKAITKRTITLEENWWCTNHIYPVCSFNQTIMNFLSDSASKIQQCYQEIKTIIDKSEKFALCREIYEGEKNVSYIISNFTNKIYKTNIRDSTSKYSIGIELNENSLLSGAFLADLTEYFINTKKQEILENLEEGLATPLEIIFQPDIPIYPMKMSSINEGSTKINVYFISDYYADDSSGLLTTKGKSSLSWAPSISNYNVGDYVTWMTYEGNTKDLTGDSYFISE
jgi:hypothetical protein